MRLIDADAELIRVKRRIQDIDRVINGCAASPPNEMELAGELYRRRSEALNIEGYRTAYDLSYVLKQFENIKQTQNTLTIEECTEIVKSGIMQNT